MVGGEALVVEGVVVADQPAQLVRPGPDVGLPHPDLHLLVEHVQHRQRVQHAAV